MERALPNALARAVALVVRVIPVMIQRHSDIRDPFLARSSKPRAGASSSSTSSMMPPLGRSLVLRGWCSLKPKARHMERPPKALALAIALGSKPNQAIDLRHII